MRRTLMIGAVSAAFALFMSFACLCLWNYLEMQQILAIGDTGRTTMLQVMGSAADPRSVASALDSLSRAYNVSIIRVSDGVDARGLTTRLIAGAFSWDSFPTDQLRLVSGRLPRAPGEFLASFETGDPGQVGVVFDFGGDDPISVRSLSDAAPDTADGVYKVVSTADYDRDAVVRAASGIFGIPSEELLRPKTFSERSLTMAAMAACVMAAASILIYLLVVASAPASRAKDVGVKKLVGWSDGAVL